MTPNQKKHFTKEKLWYLLQLKYKRFHFRYCYPMPPYIVDFYSEQLQLIIEIESEKNKGIYDVDRKNFLEKNCLQLIYLKKEQIENDINGVQKILKNYCYTAISPYKIRKYLLTYDKEVWTK